jgi:hypothetical protein
VSGIDIAEFKTRMMYQPQCDCAGCQLIDAYEQRSAELAAEIQESVAQGKLSDKYFKALLRIGDETHNIQSGVSDGYIIQRIRTMAKEAVARPTSPTDVGHTKE